MRLFDRSRFAGLTRFFSKLPGFSKPDKHSIHFLNCAQFMGVLNDNIFKLVIAFLLIDIQGQRYASSILSTAGAVFVIPFLLFSSSAGILADRFSKQRLMVVMKIAEIIIMTLAMLAFGLKSVWASYTLLFLLSTHSAMFGPSKYAIISELVPQERVSSANGLITSFTYLGVIIGTFLASFLTEITDHNFILVASFCLFIAIIGFFSTFGIKYTTPQGSEKKINPLFLREIWNTLTFCKTRDHLLIAMTGSAFFLFIGAFTQLNIIPFAIESLKLNEVAGGYLFLSTALGIAVGSYLGGKASKRRVELGLSCFAGLVISCFLFFLSLFPTNLFVVIFLLVLLGIFGGLFIVPFDSFVQMHSPDEKRGQIIAANNFLSFCGVLLASFALFFYSQILDLSPSSGFGYNGILTLLLSIFMFFRLSDLSLPYFAKKIIQPWHRPKIENEKLLEENSKNIIILKSATWPKALLLMAFAPKLHLIIPRLKPGKAPWFKRLFYSVHHIPTDPSYEPLLEYAKQLSSDAVIPCICLPTDEIPTNLRPSESITSIFNVSQPTFSYASISLQRNNKTIYMSK